METASPLKSPCFTAALDADTPPQFGSIALDDGIAPMVALEGELINPVALKNGIAPLGALEGEFVKVGLGWVTLFPAKSPSYSFLLVNTAPPQFGSIAFALIPDGYCIFVELCIWSKTVYLPTY